MKALLKKIVYGLVLLAMVPGGALAQDTGSISGTVTDAETGDPLPGASVLVVETQQGGAADVDGTYTIEGVAPGTYTLRPSFVGYRLQEEAVEVTVEAGETVTQDFQLVPSYTDLDEVVVIGYGTRSRRGVTGAVANVDVEEITNVPTTSPGELLQGRVAGVQVNRASGLPGSAIQIDIRGTASINSGTQPLYVIDGIPARSRQSASDFGQENNALQFLNPQNIQSIEVLKGASAAAIYGSRAANGVVLITTKTGRAGPTDISASYYVGAVSATEEFDVLSASEYVTILREAATNLLVDLGVSPGDVPREALAAAGGVVGINWPALPDPGEAVEYGTVDDVFRTGLQQQFSLSARGGNQRTRFYVNGTYFGTDGYVLGNSFQRINGRVNLNHEVNDDVRLSSKLGVARLLNVRASADNNVSGILTSAVLRPPTVPVRNPDGSFLFVNPYNIAENSIGSAAVNDAEDFEWRVNGNISAEVDPIESLTLAVTGGVDFYTVDQYFLNNFQTVDGRPSGAREQDYFEERRYLLQGTAEYTNLFGEKHFFSILGGASYESTARNQVFAAGLNVATPALLNVGSAAQPTTTFSGVDRQLELISYFSRANYSYDDRYIFDVSFRVDGSSRFSEDNRFGVFPSASAAWRISDERFMEPVEFIDELKLRVGYGVTGNDQIFSAVVDAFPALGLFESGEDANYGGVGGLIPVQLVSPDLSWEQSSELNIGLDVGLFNQRVFLTANFYNKVTDDLIQSVDLPRLAGINDYVLNVGSVRNRGFELALETQNLTGEFSWSTQLNVFTNNNEVTSLVDQDGDGVGDPLPDEPFDVNRIEVGRPIGSYYLITYEGVDPETGAPIFTDVNDDGSITAADRTFVGASEPDWAGGISNRFAYKGLSLSFFFQFEVGGEFYNDTKEFASSISTFNTFNGILDRWQEPGDQTNVPRLVLFDFNDASRESTRFLEDGSYLRLKDVTLAYVLPERLTRSLGLKSARIFVKGQNLLTFTEVTFADPEGSSLGGSPVFFSPPQQKSIQGGIDLTF